jgi:regulator of protease activity HflC (stomatin/prohibitin superfamily)
MGDIRTMTSLLGTIQVDAVVYFEVVEPVRAAIGVEASVSPAGASL